jgi:hypothetical protein
MNPVLQRVRSLALLAHLLVACHLLDAAVLPERLRFVFAVHIKTIAADTLLA